MVEQIYKTPRRRHFFSNGSLKSLQEIPLILEDLKSSTDTSKTQIQDWMQKAQAVDKLIGIKRSMIPCLPISIMAHEDSEKCFNLAKAIGETAQPKILPSNYDQACWYLTLKYSQQALGIAIAQKLYPRCLYNPFHPLDILLNPESKYFEYVLDSLELDEKYRQEIADSLKLKPNCIERLLDSAEAKEKEIEKLLKSLQLTPECRQQFLASLDKFDRRGLFCRHLPYKSVRNLIRSTEINLARYRLIEAGFSILKTKAEAEKLSFNFPNHTELFLKILRDEFKTAWLSNPLNDDYQCATKKTQIENLTAKIRILEGKEWETDNITTRGQFNFFRLKELPFNSEATPQYLEYLKTNDWSSYWLYIFYDLHKQLRSRNNGSVDRLNEQRKHYARLAEENQWSDRFVSEIPPEHLEGYVYMLWRDYLKIYKKHKNIFIDEFDWLAGSPNQSRTTNNRQQVKAQIDCRGYIHWVWA
ncbi:MAG: hypothetical protein QNJ72_40140 [Pleurocapsa sp. MO_226.B13]|nr:hypothetical protein [Pleurocapsa sp. MO_226.B13]